MITSRLIASPTRHAELVSASTPHSAMTVPMEKWTLKRVQGDGEGMHGDGETALRLYSRAAVANPPRHGEDL